MRLRPGQIEVANYSGGYLAVPAVPGSGKTTCLAYLVARLIKENPGDRILVVTVMRSAVANFKHKISDFLAEMGLPPRGYEVKTLHSLALQILKEKPEFMLVNEAFEIIEEGTQKAILRQITESWLANNEDRWVAFLKRGDDYRDNWRKRIVSMISETIKRIKLQGLSERQIANIRELARENNFEFLLWVLEIKESYEWRKKQDGQVDFDDLISLAHNLLKDDMDVREYFQNRWAYLCEDEAQDSNPLQQKILYMLCGKYKNLVRVGDTNQGIMRFSGTDPNLFRRYCSLDRVERQLICAASRSTLQIMDLANDFIAWVKNQYPLYECRNALESQSIVGVDSDDLAQNPVIDDFGIETLFSEGDIKDELSLVTERAAALVKKHSDKSIAILLRKNEDVKAIGKSLEKRGLLVDYPAITTEIEHNYHHVSDILAIVRFLAFPYEPEYLVKIMESLIPDFEQIHPFASKFIDLVNPEDLFYPVGGEFDWSNAPEELAPGAVASIQNAVNTARRWLEMSHLPIDELVLQLASELNLEENEREMANSLSALVSYHLRQHPEHGIHEVAGEIENMKSYLRYMAGVLQDSKGFTPRPGAVTVSTYHKAKGLEWDFVFMTGVAKDSFCELAGDKSVSEAGYLLDDYRNPTAIAHAQLDILIGKKISSNPIRQAKLMEICEDLRLLYMAFTRARERLFIGSHRMVTWGEKQRPLRSSIVFQYLQNYIQTKQG